jgi:HlyD family secretion protein
VLEKPKQPLAVVEKPRAAREFQPAALSLEEETPRLLAIGTLVTLTATLACAVVWACLARVDEVVVARGQLVTSASPFTIQAVDRAAITSVRVKVGQTVHKGEVLATLDPEFAAADVATYENRVEALQEQSARLKAELANTPYLAGSSPSPAQRLQAGLYRSRQLEYQAKVRGYDEDLSRLKASLVTQTTDFQMQRARVKPMSEIEEIRRKLVEKNYDSRLRLLEFQSQKLSAERDMTLAENKIAEIGHQIENGTAERAAYIQSWRSKTAEELTEVRRQLDIAEGDLRKAKHRSRMDALRAPEDAIVLDTGQRTIGSVLREGEPLFTLVPLSAPLLAEVRVKPEDIGRIVVGDKARIKLDAFPFQAHGTAAGKIAVISADAFTADRGGDGARVAQASDDASQIFHKARIELTDTHLLNAPKDYRLVPGMSVTAEILVGRRTVMSYLLYPIFKGFSEAAREP